MARLVPEAGQLRLDRRKSEGSGARLVARIVIIIALLKARLQVVLAADYRCIVLNDGAAVVAPSGIPGSESAARANAAALEWLPPEGQRREMRWRYVLQPDFLRPALVHVNALIIIAKPVVADRKMVQHRGADGPVVGEPPQQARGVL